MFKPINRNGKLLAHIRCDTIVVNRLTWYGTVSRQPVNCNGVTTNVGQQFTIAVYRLTWYGTTGWIDLWCQYFLGWNWHGSTIGTVKEAASDLTTNHHGQWKHYISMLCRSQVGLLPRLLLSLPPGYISIHTVQYYGWKHALFRMFSFRTGCTYSAVLRKTTEGTSWHLYGKGKHNHDYLKPHGLESGVKERLTADNLWCSGASVALIGAVLRAEGYTFLHKPLREHIRYLRHSHPTSTQLHSSPSRSKPRRTVCYNEERNKQEARQNIENGLDRPGLLAIKEGETIGIGIITKQFIPQGCLSCTVMYVYNSTYMVRT